MQSIHIRNIFSLFVPLSCNANLEAVPLIGSNHFGFALAEKNQPATFKYHVHLYYEDHVSDKEVEAPSAFSWAKRNLIQFKKTEDTETIEGVILRIKVNHGIFDFRKIDEQLVRIQVSCWQGTAYLQQGTTAILQLLPKKRNGVTDGEPFISMGWMEHSRANNNSNINEVSPISYDNEDNVREIMESPSLEPQPELIIAAEPMQMYDSNPESPSSFLALPQPHEQYMVLFNGNAEVIGNFRALNFYKASDINIKEDIRLLQEDGNPRDVLLKIDGVNYKFKKDVTHATNRRFVGYIAQQVESVVPDAVQLIDGILHVDYESLIPYLSESIRANYNDIKNIRSATDKLNVVVDALYDQFLKHSKSSVTEITPSATTPTPKTKRTISKLWYAVIATVCALGLVGGLAAVLVTSNSGAPPTPPYPIITPTQDALNNQDKDALIELYHATNGPNWRNNTGWLTHPNSCTWYGVECDGWEHRVMELRLVANNLSGTIPKNITKMMHVRVIVLSNNTLHGTIPGEITTLRELKRLDLSHNRLEGTIPQEIGNMPLLRVLYLNHNNLTGRMPHTVAETNTIQDLDLSNNQLGSFLTDFIGNSIRFLDLSFNQIYGLLPMFSASISHLNLESNHFSGPTWKLESLSQIEDLNIGHNKLSGEFRLTEAQYRQIVMIDIAFNKFTSFAADGIQNWSGRVLCDISHNNFTCPLDTVVNTRCYNSCR